MSMYLRKIVPINLIFLFTEDGNNASEKEEEAEIIVYDEEIALIAVLCWSAKMSPIT